jgi:hypothetical protein
LPERMPRSNTVPNIMNTHSVWRWRLHLCSGRLCRTSVTNSALVGTLHVRTQLVFVRNGPLPLARNTLTRSRRVTRHRTGLQCSRYREHQNGNRLECHTLLPCYLTVARILIHVGFRAESGHSADQVSCRGFKADITQVSGLYGQVGRGCRAQPRAYCPALKLHRYDRL